MESSTGILLDSLEWSPDDADLTICCNVCLHGLGFYAPSHNAAYYAKFTDILSLHLIFNYEALHHISNHMGCPIEDSSSQAPYLHRLDEHGQNDSFAECPVWLH